jgi:hypothetical protein
VQNVNYTLKLDVQYPVPEVTIVVSQLEHSRKGRSQRTRIQGLLSVLHPPEISSEVSSGVLRKLSNDLERVSLENHIRR